MTRFDKIDIEINSTNSAANKIELELIDLDAKLKEHSENALIPRDFTKPPRDYTSFLNRIFRDYTALQVQQVKLRTKAKRLQKEQQDLLRFYRSATEEETEEEQVAPFYLA